MRWHRFLFSVIGGLTILPILALIALLPDRPIYAVGRPYSVLLDLLRLAAWLDWSMGCSRPVS